MSTTNKTPGEDASSAIMDASTWTTHEANGNVGMEWVINPTMYPEIAKAFGRKQDKKLTTIDFGGGTGMMANDLLADPLDNRPALNHCRDAILQLRERLEKIHVVEINQDLIREGKRKFAIPVSQEKIQFQHFNIGDLNSSYPFAGDSISGATSRQVLMHLNNESLTHHLQEVHRILQENAWYVFSVLNPVYEAQKWREDQPEGAPKRELLAPGERYSYPHFGHNGERIPTWQYHRTIRDYQRFFKATGFGKVVETQTIPLVEDFKESHPRYYAKDPMGVVFGLKKISR